MNDVSPTTFTDVVRALCWLMGACATTVIFINGIRDWFRKPEKTPDLPQPMVVEFAKRFVPQETHEAFVSEVRGNFRAVDEKLNKADMERRESVSRCYKNTEKLVSDMRAEQREDVFGINKRMDELLKAVSRMEGKINA